VQRNFQKLDVFLYKQRKKERKKQANRQKKKQRNKETSKQTNKQINQINDDFFFSQAAEVYSPFTTSAKFTTLGPIGGLHALPWEQGGLEPESPPLEN
jgi:hypothetical protein